MKFVSVLKNRKLSIQLLFLLTFQRHENGNDLLVKIVVQNNAFNLLNTCQTYSYLI